MIFSRKIEQYNNNRMDIEQQQDKLTIPNVDDWMSDHTALNVQCPLFITPEHLRQPLELVRNCKKVKLDFNTRDLKANNQSLSFTSRLNNHSLCNSPDPCNTSTNMTLQTSLFAAQRVFKTPPKKARNDVEEERTKKEYRQRKQHQPDDEEISRFNTDYQVLGKLGYGCFGVVKKCLNRVDQTVYAVKIMSCHDRKNINEVKALATLSNKGCTHIVRYHHSWIEQRELYMVMEYCEHSLNTILEERRRNTAHFTEDELRKISIDVLKALVELHRQNVVHLDIKPDNILKTFSGKFKLGDLGLCRSATLSYGEDINEGDSKYMARQILNNFNIEEIPDLSKADIFSLGMTLYELITLEKLPGNGPIWHQLREGYTTTKLDSFNHLYSRSFLRIVKNMTDSKFRARRSALDILGRPYFSDSNRRRLNYLTTRHFSI